MPCKTFIEEADYIVTATLRLHVGFSPIERSSPLSKHDAIANAMGSVDYGRTPTVWDTLESEGWSVEFDAERA